MDAEVSLQALSDLANCDKEPIRVPGSIQPHGCLIVLDETSNRVLRASANSGELLGAPLADLFDQPISQWIGRDAAERISQRCVEIPFGSQPIYLDQITCGTGAQQRAFDLLAHRIEGSTIVELELNHQAIPMMTSPLGYYDVLDEFSLQAEEINHLPQLYELVAAVVRKLTDYDRVLVYQFDADSNGTVVGESGNNRLPVYLHHRFPGSDIPAQARELYLLNRIRIIPDSEYAAVPIVSHPTASTVLDMTYCTLRSVSPIHVEYMRNMRTASSMSISVLRNGKLWGLISCHHATPKFVPYAVRKTCDLLARAFVLRLSALEFAAQYERRVAVRTAYSNLLGIMTARGDFVAGLSEHSQELLSFMGSDGAAILSEGACRLIGRTPAETDVLRLAEWLQNHAEDVFSTDSLSEVYSPAAAFVQSASGLVAISISKLHPSFVMWFRPEVVQSIEWGGNPKKEMEIAGEGLRLHPRKSFETWHETVRDHSRPWDPSEIEGAGQLRNAIVGTVLKKAEELVQLNAELQRSNRELEAFSYSVSHDLRAPLRHIVGYAEMLKESEGKQLSPRSERCVDVIIESSEYAGILVDKLLGYSRLGRAELQLTSIDMNLLIAEIQRVVMRDAENRQIDWRIGKLPTISGDLMMLRMAFGDLMSNAVKYTREQPHPVIEVECIEAKSEYQFRVADNGVGFDMQYVDKLFGVFQRLHRWEDYEGTGIGLANVRRVIERHGGRTWAEGQEGKGATFYVTLPREPKV